MSIMYMLYTYVYNLNTQLHVYTKCLIVCVVCGDVSIFAGPHLELIISLVKLCIINAGHNR